MTKDEEPDPKTVSRLDDGVEPGVWRYVQAKRAKVLIDAEDYFAAMQRAMLNARYRIFLVGWDFDTRIHLDQGRRWYERPFKKGYPRRLGAFFAWMVRHNKTLEIRILKWSFGVFKFTFRGSMWWDLLRWFRHRRIDFKFDTAHPVGCSHHQKIAVLDNSLAVCGGIDMTARRWDTSEHRENDPRRKTPSGFEYMPWHDASMMMEGDVSDAISDLARDRWIRAGGKPLVPLKAPDESLWPDELEPDFENVEVGIARTRAKYRDWEAVREIETLFVQHIKRAKKFIYAESQYFASQAIAEAIIERMEEDDPPEVLIVHPASADGWLESQAMDHTRAEIVRCIEEVDEQHCFSIWCPRNGDTDIYVHAKIMIVDDEVLRIGSANMNNRSMGLDSECDIFIDATREGNEHAAEAIRRIRLTLLAEHTGLDIDAIAQMLDVHETMAATIDQLAKTDGRRLCRYHPPDLNEVEETIAQSGILDPEDPEDLFEPFAKDGPFSNGSRLGRIRRKVKRIWGK
ncbi:phospholipase D-like domain-containing protein [Qipengyuania sp. XHP0207]|uniref:phospholipase D-like domain-containing protein n=1 Tax=Qipengyuania sp. XHP0207 TaxID=3038078 RepID=UPI00241EB859|nr:phospholipase D-like domain-containing protein [Qipengyuania sp. XHP0207]MDG5748579.1 phospholipase D-like domain-containing protein [Qipengyuania sp. XHP0207]